MFERSDLGSDDQLVTNDLQLVSITGDRLSHDLFPDILNLQSLYPAFDAALFQEFIDRIPDRKFTHAVKLKN